jgi:hypothetical protein
MGHKLYQRHERTRIPPLFIVLSLGLVLGLVGACGPGRSEPDVLRVAVPPNPNMVPLLVALEQQEDLAVELVPVPGPAPVERQRLARPLPGGRSPSGRAGGPGWPENLG